MPMNLGLGLGLSRRIGGGSAPALPILDTVTGAGAAYSTRRLRSAYTGAAIRVRRSSDNTEQDIGFAGNALDTTALTTFVGSNSGFVVTWYDQSGNARDVTQATQANQPRIVNAGTIDVQNSVPSPFFNGTSHHLFNTSPFMYAAGAASIFAVYQGAAVTATRIVSEGNNVSNVVRYGVVTKINAADLGITLENDVPTPILNNAAAPTLTNALNGTLRQIAFRDSGSAIDGFLQGVPASPQLASYTRSGTVTLNRFSIGAYLRPVAAGFLSGYISEVICFPSFLNNDNLNAVNLSQGEAYGISVAPFLTPVQQLGVINGTGDGGPSFATNLGGVPDWEEPVFIDRAKSARGWQVPEANLDGERALASLPGTDTTANFIFSSFRDGGGVHVSPQPDLSGRFRAILTSGAASAMTGFGVTNITQISANVWEFDCDYIGVKSLIFTPTAFPVKVAVVQTTEIAAYNAGQIYRQPFLDLLPSGGCLRFMDWNGVNLGNGNIPAPVDTLAGYPVESWQRWQRVPLSAIVSLCNTKSADPWICIGHLFPDDAVTAWAEYLRDNLNPARKIRVELSNEIWNTGTFRQGDHFKALAESEWGVPDGFANGIWLDRAGKRFVQIMQIFNSVFAGQTNRLIGVLAGQAGNVGIASRMLDAPQWLASEPGSYIRPSTLAKEWSIAPYINWTGGATAQGNAIKAQLDISQAAAVAYIKGMTTASLTNARGWIDGHVAVAGSRGLRLTMYEYNQHYSLNECSGSALYSGGNPVPGALDAFIEATYSQEMADAQDELRTYFRNQNGSLMAFFVSSNRASRFGTWGAKTHFSHNSAIWNDLVSWHTANPRWWAQ